jgi:hypothetical protein
MAARLITARLLLLGSQAMFKIFMLIWIASVGTRGPLQSQGTFTNEADCRAKAFELAAEVQADIRKKFPDEEIRIAVNCFADLSESF